jgi:hypothetical protein
MVNETEITEEFRQELEKATPSKLGQVGETPVGTLGIILISAYLILFSLLLLYGLVQFWAPNVPAEGKVSDSFSVSFLFWDFKVLNEISLLLIVAFAGALGSLVATLRSLYWYVGNRKLVRSWLIMYILRPFVGTTLGIVFYFVIRGGLFSAEATVQQTSTFGFAGMASLVGMFSEQAVLKLKELAETLMSKPHPGKDAKPQDEQ